MIPKTSEPKRAPRDFGEVPADWPAPEFAGGTREGQNLSAEAIAASTGEAVGYSYPAIARQDAAVEEQDRRGT